MSDCSSRRSAKSLTEYYVDVEDTAILHVAAGMLAHVHDQRIFAFGGRFSWDKILKIMRTLDPNRQIPDDFSGGEDPNEIAPRPQAERLLQELGRTGWTSLADSISANVKGADVYGKEHKTVDNDKVWS